MNEVKKLAGQTMIYGLGTIVPRFLNYAILTFFYTRFFKEAEYGIITELYAWMVLLQIVLTYGMETGFFRFSQQKENYEKIYSTAFLSLLFTSILFFIVVNIFIGPVSNILNYSNNQDYIKIFAAILAVDAITAIPFARLRSENRPGLFSIIKLSNVIVTIGAVFFLLKIAPGITRSDTGWFARLYNPGYAVGYVFVANLVGSIFTLLLLVPFALRIKMIFDRIVWRNMILYSFPLLIAGLSGSINDALDKVILRRLIGEDDGLKTVGVYGAGYKIAVLMALFIQMFRYAAEPFFFEKAKHKDARETYVIIMKYFIIIMLLVFMVINLYIPVIQIIIGKDFRESLVVVPIISLAYLLYGIYVNHSIWYKINDLTRFGAIITFSGAVITVIINLAFVPAYGYMASAWAHLASYASMILVSFLFASKYYPIDYRMIRILPYFIFAITTVFIDQYLHFDSDVLRMALNTLYIVIFIAFAQYRDGILDLFFKRKTILLSE